MNLSHFSKGAQRYAFLTMVNPWVKYNAAEGV